MKMILGLERYTMASSDSRWLTDITMLSWQRISSSRTPPNLNTVFGKEMMCTSKPLEATSMRWEEKIYFSTFSRNYVIG